MKPENLQSIRAFDGKCKKPAALAGAKSCYDEIMYGETKKDIALSRLAAWGSVLDVLRAETVLTDGQITTIVDAAPAIVGKQGLQYLQGVNSHSEMGTFILSEGANYGPGIMAAAQLWSLFHLSTKTWPDQLFKNSEISKEGAALLGLTYYHLQKGDFTSEDFKPRQFLSGLIAKAHNTVKLAEGVAPSTQPITPEEASATLLHLVELGKYESIGASTFCGIIPEAAPTPAMLKEFGIKGKGGEVVFLRPNETAQLEDAEIDADSPRSFKEWAENKTNEDEQEDIASIIGGGSEMGGDGAFLGYQSLQELKRKFNGAGVRQGNLPASVWMKRQPFTHAIYCKFRSQAEKAKALGGGMDDDDVYQRAIGGKGEFMTEHYTPIFSQGMSGAAFGGDEAAEKKHGIAKDSRFDTSSVQVDFSCMVTVDGYRCARFADSNHYSNKRVQELFQDIQPLVRPPQTALFTEVQKNYRQMLTDGISHDEAVEAVLSDAAKKHAKVSTETLWTYGKFLGKPHIDSLDQKLGDDTTADIHNMMPHDMLEEYSQNIFAEITEGVDQEEITIHAAYLDLAECRSGDLSDIENSFRQIHSVLVSNERTDLAAALEIMSNLCLPSAKEFDETCDTLRYGSSSFKTGRVLSEVFINSHRLLSEATKNTFAGLSDGVTLQDAAKDSPGDNRDKVLKMAARFRRVGEAALPAALEHDIPR